MIDSMLLLLKQARCVCVNGVRTLARDNRLCFDFNLFVQVAHFDGTAIWLTRSYASRNGAMF